MARAARVVKVPTYATARSFFVSILLYRVSTSYARSCVQTSVEYTNFRKIKFSGFIRLHPAWRLDCPLLRSKRLDSPPLRARTGIYAFRISLFTRIRAKGALRERESGDYSNSCILYILTYMCMYESQSQAGTKREPSGGQARWSTMIHTYAEWHEESEIFRHYRVCTGKYYKSHAHMDAERNRTSTCHHSCFPIVDDYPIRMIGSRWITAPPRRRRRRPSASRPRNGRASGFQRVRDKFVSIVEDGNILRLALRFRFTAPSQVCAFPSAWVKRRQYTLSHGIVIIRVSRYDVPDDR